MIYTLSLVILLTGNVGFGGAAALRLSVLAAVEAVVSPSGVEDLVVDADPDVDVEDLSQLISLACCFNFMDRSLVVF